MIGARTFSGFARILATTMSAASAGSEPLSKNSPATPLRRAFAAAAATASWSMSTPIARAELQRGDCQYTGTATVVEHGFPAGDAALQPPQAESRGRVAPRSEREARVEQQVHRVRCRTAR